MNQEQAASHILEILKERRVRGLSSLVRSEGGEQWLVFERQGREVGIDEATGIWLRESGAQEWRQVAKTNTTSGVAMAIDFLMNEPSSEHH